MITWEERNKLIELYKNLVDEENMYLRKLVNNQKLTDIEENRHIKIRNGINEISAILLENEIPF